MKRRFFALAALTGALALYGAAQATDISGADLIGEYNLIVLGDATVSSETEGPVYVGGTLTSNGYTVNPAGLPNGSLGGALVVGGDLNNLQVAVQSGDVLIGGAQNALINNNGGGTITTGAAVPTADVSTAMTSFSSTLAALASTGGSVSGDMNNKTVNAVAGLDGIAVLDLDASFFSAGAFSLTYSDTTTPTIINVSGANVSISANANGAFDNVIWNFYEATTLSIAAAFNASILAPLADAIVTGGGINGTVVVGSLEQHSEIRPPLFTPDIPTEVPLPGAFVLLMTGLGGLFGARRFR